MSRTGFTNVLIVDDDKSTRRLHELALEEAAKGSGHTLLLTTSPSVVDAREHLVKGRKDFDILLLDGNLRDGSFSDIIDDTPLGNARVCVISNSPETVEIAKQHDSVHFAEKKPFGFDDTVNLFTRIIETLN